MRTYVYLPGDASLLILQLVSSCEMVLLLFVTLTHSDCNLHLHLHAFVTTPLSSYCILQVTKQMEGVTKTMGKIMKTMDLEKTDKTMQAFEKTFEELDVLTSVSICYPLYNQKALFH